MKPKRAARSPVGGEHVVLDLFHAVLVFRLLFHAAGTVQLDCASVRFRRMEGYGIVSITAGNAALSRRCPGRSRPKQLGAPEEEVGKCPCGRLYGLSPDEERIHFHRAESR